jgi:hypothetical protein
VTTRLKRDAPEIAKGTRGQLRGVKPGKAQGGRKGNRTGGALKTLPVHEKMLEQHGIDKALAKRMRTLRSSRRQRLMALRPVSNSLLDRQIRLAGQNRAIVQGQIGDRREQNGDRSDESGDCSDVCRRKRNFQLIVVSL